MASINKKEYDYITDNGGCIFEFQKNNLQVVITSCLIVNFSDKIEVIEHKRKNHLIKIEWDEKGLSNILNFKNPVGKIKKVVYD